MQYNFITEIHNGQIFISLPLTGVPIADIDLNNDDQDLQVIHVTILPNSPNPTYLQE